MLGRAAFNAALPAFRDRLSAGLGWPLKISRIQPEALGEAASADCVMELQCTYLAAAAGADDEAAMVQVHLQIGHSPAYACPVLYFGLSHVDGRPLSPAQVAAFFRVRAEAASMAETGAASPSMAETGAASPSVAETSAASPEQRRLELAGSLSQIAHPQLGYPVYTLHPCRTSELVGLLLSASQSERAPSTGATGSDGAVSGDDVTALLCWLGVYGRSVGLDLPPECFV